jgi:hypothetical protein
MRRRPVVTRRAAAENSLRRSFLGSHRRAMPVRASIGIQARRSRASWTISSHSWLLAAWCRGSAQAGGTGGPDAVLGSGAPAVPKFQGSDRRAGGVGGETRQAHAVGVGESQLRTGVGTFFADDQPHPVRPALQDVTGRLGAPGAVADLAIGSDRRAPSRLRNLEDSVVDGVGDGHPDGVGQPPAPSGEPVQELVGAACGVGPDQGRATPPVLLGQLGQCQFRGGDVVGGGVAAGVAGRSRAATGSPDPACPWSTNATSG